MRLLLPAFFGVSLVHEVHGALRLATHGLRREVPEDPALKEIGDEYTEAAGAIEKSTKKAFRDAQKGPGSYGDAKKPMMDGVEVTRMMLCWGRAKLLEHEQCMNWMVQNCQEETTGSGYCRKLRRYVKAKCKRGNEKGCNYAKDLGIEMEKDTEEIPSDDEDGDGFKDSEDDFPDNPIESKDSDGDKIGDNTDRYPNDPTRAHEGEPPAAPSPAVMGAPAPGPMPTGLTMSASALLPSQGYNEHSIDYVAHTDQKTMTEDWHSEWPRSEGTEEESIEQICVKQPNHPWCKLQQSHSARKAYSVSHP